MTRAFRPLLLALVLAAAMPAAARSPQVPPSAQMTVAAFMERIADLRSGGPEWTLSPEAGELFAVLSGVGKAYRQTLADRLASGQPVEACLPPEAEIDGDVLFEHLAGYRADQAGQTSIADAFAELVRKRFPCP